MKIKDIVKEDGASEGSNEMDSPITLLKYPDRFKNTFHDSAKKSTLLLRSEEYEESVLYLNKTLDLLQLGKQILHDVSPFFKVCIYGNFACAYQKLWQIQRCSKYCQKVEQELKSFLAQETRKDYKLNLTKQLIKIKFEQCALLSQLHKHDLAIEICYTIFPLIENFLLIVSGYIEGKLKNEKTKKSCDNISFVGEVYEFSHRVHKNLLQNLKQPCDEAKRQQFYFWTKNPEKNQEQIIRKFFGLKDSTRCKKSILGVTKSKNWINDFNIGSVMHIGEFTIENFEQPCPLEQYVFKEKIYESVIFCSLTHFTLATEIRFIEFNRQKEELIRKTSEKMTVADINKKYGYQDLSDYYLLSERHHLKSIDIISKNIQFTIPYLTHIIRSYEKHYISNKPLDKIFSIPDQSYISVGPPDEQKVYPFLSEAGHKKNDSPKKQRSGKHSKKKKNEKGSKSKEKNSLPKNKQQGILNRPYNRLTQPQRMSKKKTHSKSNSKNKKSLSNNREKSEQHRYKKKKKSVNPQLSMLSSLGKKSKDLHRFEINPSSQPRTKHH